MSPGGIGKRLGPQASSGPAGRATLRLPARPRRRRGEPPQAGGARAGFVTQAGARRVQADLELASQARLVSNSQRSSCLGLPTAGMTDILHRAWLCLTILNASQ